MVLDKLFVSTINNIPCTIWRANNLMRNISFRERDRTLAQAGAPVIQPQRTDGPRFTGGGFNLKSAKAAT